MTKKEMKRLIELLPTGAGRSITSTNASWEKYGGRCVHTMQCLARRLKLAGFRYVSNERRTNSKTGQLVVSSKYVDPTGNILLLTVYHGQAKHLHRYHVQLIFAQDDAKPLARVLRSVRQTAYLRELK